MEKFRKYPKSMNEGIRVEEVPSCLLCGGDGVLLYENLRDRLFSAPGVWTLMRCPNCRLVWLSPRPIDSDIAKLYKEYFAHDVHQLVPQFAGMRRFIRNAVLESHMGYDNLGNSSLGKRIGKILSWVGPLKQRIELSVMTLRGNKKGRLLDVGCGIGIFLEKMRSLGWEVIGVETDEKAVEVARKRFGLNTHQGTLEQMNFPDESMDAIVVHHVIEHVGDPIRTLKECYRILKPLGRLVITTPNMEGLGQRFFKKAYVHLDPPRHLYLFSPHTLQVCAEKAGLQILGLRTIARRASWTWITSYLIRKNGRLPGGIPKNRGFWLRLEGLAFHETESLFCFIKNVGEEILLVSTKYLDE